MLSKIPQFVSTSELRTNLAKYLRHAKKEPVLISAERGKSTGVIMSATLYNTLLEAYEDSMDVRELTTLVTKGRDKLIRWNRAEYGI